MVSLTIISGHYILHAIVGGNPLMKVIKFGGSSVASAENINRVIEIILKSQKEAEQILVVVSAFGGVTDDLIKLGSLAVTNEKKMRSLFRQLSEKHETIVSQLVKPSKRGKITEEVRKKCRELQKVCMGVSLVKELSPRTLDTITSFGEQLSSYIICKAIEDRGVACDLVDARMLITTDDAYGSANVETQSTYKQIADYFRNSSALSIMGGFIAATEDGITTTLGRGGSDYTASLVGAAADASAIEIWTDVDGVMTADPRAVTKAFSVSEISYEEAGELAHFGAKVIHPKTMKPARLKNIPIYIKNTFNPNHSGTKISNATPKNGFPITGISTLGNISLLQVQLNNEKTIGEIAARLFDTLHRAGIEILLTTQASSEQSISVAVTSPQAQKAKKILEKAFALELTTTQMYPISIEGNLSIVAIVGGQMKGKPGIAGKLFNALGVNNVNVVAIAQGSSELNVSAVINADDCTKALRCVHEAFFGGKDKTINLFLVGTGLIGSTLLRHIKQKKAKIALCGVANSSFMVFDKEGIDVKDWHSHISQGKKTDLQEFVSEMITLNLSQSVFVDCTASEDVASLYEQIMHAGIAIVTPNKKANSGKLKRYETLRNTAKENNVPFFYNTNVGAGLPIIHTIARLVSGGDNILKIEAVLSGSLSFIFNTFSTNNKPFSRIVREAQEKGYTEPDPRDDVSGMDFARKILIIAREIGLKMEISNVAVHLLIPKRYFTTGSVDQFFTALEKRDGDFEKKKKHALKNKSVLRYIATLQNGRATISLREVAQNHPFYALLGSDNIISITTKRYNETPIVIQGPGAGAKVTAGGVLADIIRCFI